MLVANAEIEDPRALLEEVFRLWRSFKHAATRSGGRIAAGSRVLPRIETLIWTLARLVNPDPGTEAGTGPSWS